MNYTLVITLRFSGEETRNSLMVCSSLYTLTSPYISSRLFTVYQIFVARSLLGISLFVFFPDTSLFFLYFLFVIFNPGWWEVG